MSSLRELALEHSACCFFNSYLRDMAVPFDEKRNCFIIRIEDSSLEIPILYYSKVGAHKYGNGYTLHSKHGSRVLNFLEAAEILCTNKRFDSRIFSRLQDSIQNIESSLEHRQAHVSKLHGGEFDFIQAEQGLLIGHNFHPTPKSRDEFSREDFFKYGPEFGASFKLSWIFVREDIVYEEHSHQFERRDWSGEIYKANVPHGFIAYPVHPWQLRVLLTDTEFLFYLNQNIIQMAPEVEEEWFATSSMRTLYSSSSPYMLKFSMSVRLTNSIRHLQKNEVSRGMHLQDAFHTRAGKELKNRFPQFQIMHEPAYMGIMNRQGEVLPQTIVLLRENPFQGSGPFVAVVLATLNQDHPYGKEANLISTCLGQGVSVADWFMAFLQNVMTPLLVAQADYGIMLGAHQQNLIIKLKNGRPEGLYFRDCQGTGYSLLGKEKILRDIPDKKGFLENIVPEEAYQALFTYYLMINSLFNTIAAVAKASGRQESEMIKMAQEYLIQLEFQVADPRIIQHVLYSPVLEQKGNFRCSLSGINENTAANPLSIYNAFTNPLFRGSPQ